MSEGVTAQDKMYSQIPERALMWQSLAPKKDEGAPGHGIWLVHNIGLMGSSGWPPNEEEGYGKGAKWLIMPVS